MDRLIMQVRFILRVPMMLTIGQHALYQSEFPGTTKGINVHTDEEVFSAYDLMEVSDEELLTKCLTK